MTQPSDETFLDEMAKAAALAKEALDYTRSFTDDEWLDAVEGLKASATPEAVLRLVALARRAPALTLTEAQPATVITETYGQCGHCGGSGRVPSNSTAAYATCSRCSGSGRLVTSRTLHAPAPPEARP